MKTDIEFKMYFDPSTGSTNIYIYRAGVDSREVFTGVKWEKVTRGCKMPPCLSVCEEDSRTFFKNMLVELKENGYCQDREELTATERHLEDMRAITFHKLNMNKGR